MNFEVNNQEYFLGLSEDEAQWQLFVATPNGPRRVPVYIDASPSDDVKVVLQHKRTTVN